MTRPLLPWAGIPVKRRRILSAAVAGLILVWGGLTIIETFAAYLAQRTELDLARAELSELMGRVSNAHAAQSAAPPLPDTVLSPAPNAEAASVHIQEALRRLEELGEGASVQVVSVRALPPAAKGGFAVVRVSASIKAHSARIFEVVNVIEASTPPIVIEALQISAREDGDVTWDQRSSERGTASSEMTLSLRVYARDESAARLPLPASPSRSASGEAQ